MGEAFRYPSQAQKNVKGSTEEKHSAPGPRVGGGPGREDLDTQSEQPECPIPELDNPSDSCPSLAGGKSPHLLSVAVSSERLCLVDRCCFVDSRIRPLH